MFIPQAAREIAAAIPREGFSWQQDGPEIVKIINLLKLDLGAVGIAPTVDLLTGILLALADQYGWDAPNMGAGTEARFYRFVVEVS